VQGDLFRGARAGRQLDWTSDQHLSRGWLTARLPTTFAWRDVSQHRERIVVHRDQGGLQITNALGVGVVKLWLADSQGRVFSGTDIEAGASQSLAPAAWTATGDPEQLGAIWDSDWSELASLAEARVQQLLEPDGYLAIVDRNPFMTIELPGVRFRRCSGAVYGRLVASGAEEVASGAEESERQEPMPRIRPLPEASEERPDAG
jgi:hypothetical protein